MTINDIKHGNYFDLPQHWVVQWLLHILAKPNAYLFSHGCYELSTAERREFVAGIQKMLKGMPLAYLIGKQAFWSLEFIVNEHTLIPRPDTEILVEHLLIELDQNLQCHPNPQNSMRSNSTVSKRLLDLGTGTGCIAISLAYELQKKYPEIWQITATDTSGLALQVAKQNAKLNEITNMTFIQSDWYAQLAKNAKYDVIVSNPPYIDKTDTHLNKLHAEPLSALIADNKGLADIEKIVNGAVVHMVEGGLLAIEHGYDQAQSVQQIFGSAKFSDIKTIQDYGNNDRVTMGRLPIVPLMKVTNGL